MNKVLKETYHISRITPHGDGMKTINVCRSDDSDLLRFQFDTSEIEAFMRGAVLFPELYRALKRAHSIIDKTSIFDNDAMGTDFAYFQTLIEQIEKEVGGGGEA